MVFTLITSLKVSLLNMVLTKTNSDYMAWAWARYCVVIVALGSGAFVEAVCATLVQCRLRGGTKHLDESEASTQSRYRDVDPCKIEERNPTLGGAVA